MQYFWPLIVSLAMNELMSLRKISMYFF